MKYLLKATIFYYLNDLYEKKGFYLKLKLYLLAIKCKFHDNKLIEQYKKVFQNYIEEIDKEINILKYLYKNHNSIFIENYYDILNKIFEIEETRINFLTEMFLNIQNALNTNLPNKLYLPRNSYCKYTEEETNILINHAKGYTFTSVCNLIIRENILTEDEIKFLKDEIKKALLENYYIPIFNYNNTKEAALANIHNFIYIAIKMSNYAKDLDEANIKDLINFYKLLYKQRHSCVDNVICCSKYAIILFETYNNEPFEEQIEKLQRIVKQDYQEESLNSKI